MNIDDLLATAMERRASDLHLKVGNHWHLRIGRGTQPAHRPAAAHRSADPWRSA